MNKSICSLHDQEEEKYICVHPICLKKVDNKLCCIQCYHSNHKNTQLIDHDFKNISELETIASQNYSKLKEHLDHEIQQNIQLRTKIEERLSNTLLSLTTWQNNQKKMFNDITENSTQILIQNIRKADTLMKSQSIDTYIYFYKLNLLENQNQMQAIRDQSMRQLEYQLNQIEIKRDILINQINFIQSEHFLSFAQMNYQIELGNLNNYQIEKCKKHQCQKEVLCIHPNCLQKNPIQLQCLQCITQDSKEHQSEDYIKSIVIVMEGQSQKKELNEELQKNFKYDIKKSVDINLLKINEAQQNYYQNYEKQKENLVLLEQQQLSQFLNPDFPKDFFDHLDQKPFTITKEQINLHYQLLHQDYQNKFQGIFSNQVNDELQFLTELDFNSKKFHQNIINQQKELELCQLKFEELQRTIQSHAFNNKIEQQFSTLNNSISSFHQKLEDNFTNLQSKHNKIQKNNKIQFKI
ncbi:unnamed protein product (macronuclear) [Paramecium tetraurelia]|uniref:B box-type domain-containing protein n=1 Tax=Paramecium tetraurelia TaxID=5888 RepID=A0DIB9_PARTE|nr:uncharacterized protein GSPATT00017158001 [Paramecium tetraurelia]CAK82786.1 unnamed protein product [Paramecium tetraurelia]|eukprot:XP_001450183.1 hypothetical protein (macronuclear) [Paramecium tetraurelia strain d4-2]